MFPRKEVAAVALTTKQRILKDAKRTVRGEKVADFLNDPKQFFHRVRVGYYHDRYLFAARWLINDTQQQIDEHYSKR